MTTMLEPHFNDEDLAEWERELIDGYRNASEPPKPDAASVERGRLIGLGGPKRSGKTTIAKHLESHYGFVHLAFADLLKETALSIDPLILDAGCSLSSLVKRSGWEIAKAIPSVRTLLRDLGEAVRQCDPDYWIRDVMAEASLLQDQGFSVVISDIRFPNELEAVREAGGLSLYVLNRRSPTDDHSSETSVKSRDFSRFIRNESDLEALEAEVAEALESGASGASILGEGVLRKW